MTRQRYCLNPKCGERIAVSTPLPLCPCCRLAGRWGAGLAFVVFLVGHVLADIDWGSVVSAVLERLVPQ